MVIPLVHTPDTVALPRGFSCSSYRRGCQGRSSGGRSSGRSSAGGRRGGRRGHRVSACSLRCVWGMLMVFTEGLQGCLALARPPARYLRMICWGGKHTSRHGHWTLSDHVTMPIWSWRHTWRGHQVIGVMLLTSACPVSIFCHERLYQGRAVFFTD